MIVLSENPNMEVARTSFTPLSPCKPVVSG